MINSGWLVIPCVVFLSACAQPAAQSVEPDPDPPTLSAAEAREWVAVRYELHSGKQDVRLVADGPSAPREIHISTHTVEAATDSRVALDTVLERIDAHPVRIEVALDAAHNLDFTAVVKGADGETFSVPLPAGVAGAWIVTRDVPVRARRGAMFLHGRCPGCRVVINSPDMKDPFNRG